MATGNTEFLDNRVKPFSAGLGTAKLSYTITVPSGSSHYLMINSNATGNRALLYVGATSTGVIGRNDLELLGYTITNGNGSITITIEGTTARPIYILDHKIRGNWISVS